MENLTETTSGSVASLSSRSSGLQTMLGLEMSLSMWQKTPMASSKVFMTTSLVLGSFQIAVREVTRERLVALALSMDWEHSHSRPWYKKKSVSRSNVITQKTHLSTASTTLMSAMPNPPRFSSVVQKFTQDVTKGILSLQSLIRNGHKSTSPFLPFWFPTTM